MVAFTRNKTGRLGNSIAHADSLPPTQPQILLELDENGNIRKTYIYANDQLIAAHEGDYSDDTYYYLHDRLGSVRMIVDHTGNVAKTYTYSPFGPIRPGSNAFYHPRFDNSQMHLDINSSSQYSENLAFGRN